ncbi:signal transduction histidine kinase [Bradyrhizobium huanghuaihaiense]
MIERKGIARTPREHFRRTAEDELEKFVRKEIAFQQAERIERARELRLPVQKEIVPSCSGPSSKPVTRRFP